MIVLFKLLLVGKKGVRNDQILPMLIKLKNIC
jgi:hypothetical protein